MLSTYGIYVCEHHLYTCHDVGHSHQLPVLNLRTTIQKRAALPRRAHIQGSWSFASLNSRLEMNEEEEAIRATTCTGHVMSITVTTQLRQRL